MWYTYKFEASHSIQIVKLKEKPPWQLFVVLFFLLLSYTNEKYIVLYCLYVYLDTND